MNTFAEWTDDADAIEALERWRQSGYSLDGIAPEMIERMKASLSKEAEWARAQRETTPGLPPHSVPNAAKIEPLK